MKVPVDICNLDYLTGTLATAYKGLVTSLVIKDFCMTGSEGSVMLKGHVFTVPPGDYYASLIHDGTELARAFLHDGRFELEASADRIRDADNLQIDIVQKGRHIGTFLLKKEEGAGYFVPALELAEGIKGADLKDLTLSLRHKPGLLKKAESVVSMVLSAKKDWLRFSDEINTFSNDLFWFERDVFRSSYVFLLRHAFAACGKTEEGGAAKAVANVLSLLELPLDHEEAEDKLRPLVRAWLAGLAGAPVDLTYQSARSIRVMTKVCTTFPDEDLSGVMGAVAESLRSRLSHPCFIKEEIAASLESIVPTDDMALIDRYRDGVRRDLLERISSAEAQRGECLPFFEALKAVEALIPEPRAMLDDVFRIVGRNITAGSAGSLLTVLERLFRSLDLQRTSQERTVKDVASLLKELVSARLFDASLTLMEQISAGVYGPGETILLTEEIASEVVASGRHPLIDHYVASLCRIVIPPAVISGLSRETWAEIVDPAHLETLIRFLRIIGLDSRIFRDVVVHVLCSVSAGGVFIPDDRLFQREVSRYLNCCDLRTDFLLHFLLLQRLPVYFNEVGASGGIRDYTTQIDSWGNDPVLYFVRKQVHVNASSRNIGLLESVLTAWVRNDPALLSGLVPEELLQTVDAGLVSRYSIAIRGMLKDLGLLEGDDIRLEGLLSISEEALKAALDRVDADEEIRSKVFLLCRIYVGVTEKYKGPTRPVSGDVAVQSALPELADRAVSLKGIVTSPEKTEPEESLYFKRHIAFGIPSVVGSYHEPKFDALGEAVRNAEQVRLLLEDLIAAVESPGKDFSPSDVDHWISCLREVDRLFRVYDLDNFQIEEVLAVLTSNDLFFSQIVDVLTIYQRELLWMVDSLNRTFHDPLLDVIAALSQEGLAERLRRIGINGSARVHKVADVVMRDLLSSIPGFLELDRLLGSMTGVLRRMVEQGNRRLDRSGEPAKQDRRSVMLEALSQDEAMRGGPHIGGKAKNLVYLLHKGLPVPAGAVFPAGVAADYASYTETEDFRADMRKAVAILETKSGRRYGGPEKPLFLSVRSGSYISMPGILSSVLYCGMNEETVRGLIAETGDALSAWDSCRRFFEDFSTIVLGLEAGVLERVRDRFVKACGKTRPAGLDEGQLKELVRDYRRELTACGAAVPDDPYRQLEMTIRAVYGSWYSEKAEQFRKAVKVSKRWGTAVTVMEMVSGNRRGAGASVFFTRLPFSLDRGIYGDTLANATGEDIAQGGALTMPISKTQGEEGRTMEEADPELFTMHRELSARIEEAMGGLPQEVEVTYTSDRGGGRGIFILQTRRMEYHRGFTRGFDDICRMESNILGRGFGVWGGALTGIATLSSSAEKIDSIKTEGGLPAILLRQTASTDDVSLMPHIDGVVTAAGGVASHASVLAQKFDVTAVVGCSDLVISRDEKGNLTAAIGGRQVAEGAVISIDGSAGLVYWGACAVPEQESEG